MPETSRAAKSDRPEGNLPEFTVTEISAELKRTVENSFALVRVRGEISGLKRAASGHVYLTLKDDRAVLDGVIWRGVAGRLKSQIEDGLEVICTGRLTTYPARSRYQMVIEQFEPAGAGALMALLEERRRKLAAEGLFDESAKQALPFLPAVIGVVTSPTGAVIRDILHRLGDRFPRQVLLWPVLVQGEGAAEQVAAAVAGFNRLSEDGPVVRPDLIIVARGGGSLEDLWAFNEEIVVRAVAASAIPVISAVGHETDTTLVDFAADRRAPTPTAAAEIAVPVRADLVAHVMDLERRGYAAVRRRLSEQSVHVAGLARGLRDPRLVIESHQQRIDDLADGLRRALRLGVARREATLKETAGRLNLTILKQRQTMAATALGQAMTRLEREWQQRARDRVERVAGLARLLESFSYRNVLQRGFTVLRGGDSRPLTRVAATSEGQAVEIEFADGRAPAVIGAKAHEPGRSRTGGPKRSAKPAGQGSLF